MEKNNIPDSTFKKLIDENPVAMLQHIEHYEKEIGKLLQHTTVEQVAEEIHMLADNIILNARNLAKKEGFPVICKMGCSYCCYSMILISDVEFALVAKYMLQYNITPHFGDLDYGTLTREQHMATPYEKRKCPLLINNVCSIYPVRPLICRQANSISTDPKLCRKENLLNPIENQTNREIVVPEIDILQVALYKLEHPNAQQDEYGEVVNADDLLATKLWKIFHK